MELQEISIELKKALPKDYKIGASVYNRDCFFDAVAQGLTELKYNGFITHSKSFSVKSLRKICKQYAQKINQSKKGSWLEYALKGQGEKLYEYISNIVFTVEDTENVGFSSEMKIFENVIAGRPKIEGKMICEKYGIRIRVIELKNDEINGLHVTKSKVGKGNTIYLVNYRNHFIPLLFSIEKDLSKNIKVSIEEAYSNIIKKNSSEPYLYISTPQQNLENFSDRSKSYSRSVEGKPERKRKRTHSVTDKENKSKKAHMDINVGSNEDLEYCSDINDKHGQYRLSNLSQTTRCIPNQLMGLMYQLDLSVLCSHRKSIYGHKYSSLSIAFGDSEIDEFCNIVLRYENKSVHIQIKNSDRYFTDSSINYTRLFTKEKFNFSVNNYFDSFIKYLTSRLDSSLDGVEYLVVYTNSCLDLTDDKELKRVRLRNFYPFKFDIMNIEKSVILKDFLFTNLDIQDCGFHQFSQDYATREELLKRLKFTSAMQEIIKEGKYFQESEKEIKEAFLDKLVFAVNQPNREKLNSIVKSEIEKYSEVEDNYISLLGRILCDLTVPENLKKLGNSISTIIYEFNILLLFLHDIFIHDDIFFINLEGKGRDIRNNIINYRNKIIYLKAHTADKSINYSQLFPSKEQNKTFSVDKFFTLFLEKSIEDIKFLIIYTNAILDLTEENNLKKRQSKGFYPFKFDKINTQKKKYKILRNFSCINGDSIYKFSKEETTRKELLKLLKIPPSLLEESRLFDQSETEIKKKFLDRLLFAVNQYDKVELNIVVRNEIDKPNLPYNYEELHEVSLRWSESHSLGPLTKPVMGKLLQDIKNNRSSYQEIRDKDIEKIKFAKSVAVREGTPAFYQFLSFLTRGKGRKYLKNLKRKEISLNNVSSILNGAKANPSKSFKDLYDLWFDEKGNNTQYLETLVKEKVNLTTMSSILNGSGSNAAKAFKGLYDLWFDEQGSKTKYLTTLEEEGLSLSNISGILSGAGSNAHTAFKALYDLWFDEVGNKSQYLKTLEKEGINLTNMSSMLHGAGSNSAKAFKGLYDLWFDREGNKTQYLKTLEEEGINLRNVSSILHGAGFNTAKAFKGLYDLWFDKERNKTKYLKALEEEGINLSNISGILGGAGSNADIAFKDLYDLWFDKKGNKTQYLKTLAEQNIHLPNISNILHGAGSNAAKAFKGLYDLWFDDKGNKTRYSKILEEEGINLSNISGILGGSRANATKAFKDLYSLWFDKEGNKTHYLKTLEDEEGINLSNISGILGGAGSNAAKALKGLYELWFNVKGNKTQYLKTLEEEGIKITNMSSILNGAGSNAAKAFKDLYGLWFDKERNKTKYLKTLEEEGIKLSHISGILGGAGADAHKAFKELYNLWFDGEGKKTQYLKTLEEEGIRLPNISSILNGAGSKAAKAFKELFNTFFDDQGNKTQYLKTLEKEGINLHNMSSILHRSGSNAANSFKELYNAFFDHRGNKRQHLKRFIEENDGKSFTICNLSSILSGSGTKAKFAFEKLYRAFFDDEGNETELLRDFYSAGFKPGNLSCLLCGAGVHASCVLKKLHSDCFSEKRGKTKFLNDLYNAGFSSANLCNILSGSADGLEDFYDFYSTEEGKKYFNNFLKEGFTLSNLCRVLHGARANISSALRDFHDLCFDEKGYKTPLLDDFYDAGFTPSNLSKILFMAGNNVSSVLRDFHKLCFNKKNYLNHFFAVRELFTPKSISKILDRVGLNIRPTFKKLHELCFDKAGKKTDYLNSIIKNKPQNEIINLLYKKVRKLLFIS